MLSDVFACSSQASQFVLQNVVLQKLQWDAEIDNVHYVSKDKMNVAVARADTQRSPCPSAREKEADAIASVPLVRHASAKRAMLASPIWLWARYSSSRDASAHENDQVAAGRELGQAFSVCGEVA